MNWIFKFHLGQTSMVILMGKLSGYGDSQNVSLTHYIFCELVSEFSNWWLWSYWCIHYCFRKILELAFVLSLLLMILKNRSSGLKLENTDAHKAKICCPPVLTHWTPVACSCNTDIKMTSFAEWSFRTFNNKKLQSLSFTDTIFILLVRLHTESNIFRYSFL